MATISKRTREEAIDHLLGCADLHITDGDHYSFDLEDGLSEKAEALIEDLWSECGSFAEHHADEPDAIAMACLEDAALLRDGWRPGDPVVLIGGAS